MTCEAQITINDSEAKLVRIDEKKYTNRTLLNNYILTIKKIESIASCF